MKPKPQALALCSGPVKLPFIAMSFA
uniref:Uncharacterized protein n=1 Tax=Anguilla anguilla TaxID=7936 RepID=A0A0E9PEM1_ANGAN